MEYHSGAIFHASDTLLERFDSAQRGFLQEIDVTPEAAFIEHNFAPPRLRRNIGMLGFLHKRVLGLFCLENLACQYFGEDVVAQHYAQ